MLGSTGNVYMATVCRLPNCTCVDFTERGQICKHLLFVYVKVARISASALLQPPAAPCRQLGPTAGERPRPRHQTPAHGWGPRPASVRAIPKFGV